MYRSTDGGATWTNMGLRDSRHIGRIALHPEDPDLVYVAAMGHLWGPNDERGLYRSADGGETWQPILQVDENTGVVDVALDPEDPTIVYAATYQRQRRPWGFHGGGPGSALYRSTDGGDSWNRLSGPGVTRGLPEGVLGRIGISIYRSDPRIVYASVEQGYRYNASTAYTERRAGIYRSDDHGETWEHMSDWNPRPMYASQILVDPSDDQRVYMMNSYSFSDDGGRTFTVPPQSLHGDDRMVWVNPADSRHVMKADDGGLGISYDRGLNWLYISDLPVSQYYRVSVDMAQPYNVYGGLQDNGSWVGPSETYRQAGIFNSDWTRLGGGDGFINLVDTTNNFIVYTESQYLNLSRVNLRTGERTSIRPGDPTGHIGGRRNWETWKEVGVNEEQRLGNAMAPANWDGPFIISPHDASTLYAGTNILWKTTDRGDSWQALGDLTTGVDRRTLGLMGEDSHELTPSLDDGIPYWPTISAVAESPLREGLIYAGTDDGRFHISRDSGERWADVSARDATDSDESSGFPGLPPGPGSAASNPPATTKPGSTPSGTTTATTTTPTTCTSRRTTARPGSRSPPIFPPTGSCAPSGKTSATNPSSSWAPKSASSTPWTAANTGPSCAAGCPRPPSTTSSSTRARTTSCWGPTGAASGSSTRSTRSRNSPRRSWRVPPISSPSSPPFRSAARGAGRTRETSSTEARTPGTARFSTIGSRRSRKRAPWQSRSRWTAAVWPRWKAPPGEG